MFADPRSPKTAFTMPEGPARVFAHFLPGPPASAPGVSAARRWMEVLLQAVRDDFARPTVHARNLFHLSAAMYDAWAAWSETARPLVVRRCAGPMRGPRRAARRRCPARARNGDRPCGADSHSPPFPAVPGRGRHTKERGQPDVRPRTRSRGPGSGRRVRPVHRRVSMSRAVCGMAPMRQTTMPRPPTSPPIRFWNRGAPAIPASGTPTAGSRCGFPRSSTSRAIRAAVHPNS